MGYFLSVINEDVDLSRLTQECILLAMTHQVQKQIPIGSKFSVHSVTFCSEKHNVCVNI